MGTREVREVGKSGERKKKRKGKAIKRGEGR